MGCASGRPQAAAPPAPAAPTSPLHLALAEMSERTGDEFGLAVPMLLLTLRNQGQDPVEVPQLGVDLIVSLQVVIAPAATPSGRPERRAASLLRPYATQLVALPAASQLVQSLSPLSVERRDVPLLPGAYQVAVCVPPAGEAKYPSSFTDRFAGQCSAPLPIEVTRRRKR
jgi:hypothetical protein